MLGAGVEPSLAGRFSPFGLLGMTGNHRRYYCHHFPARWFHGPADLEAELSGTSPLPVCCCLEWENDHARQAAAAANEGTYEAAR